VRHLGTFYQQQHPSEGEIWGIRPLLFIDRERPGPMRPPPVLGEHSEETWPSLCSVVTKIAELKAMKQRRSNARPQED
jgi:crotonobetainyl-CoA:carnitine CoA-transferase CaiB-like acyl-CoA transferase